MAELLVGSDLVLLEALPEATLIVAPDGRIRYLNRAATELLGHERTELEGESVSRIIVPQTGQRLDVVAWFARWADDPASPQLRYLTLTGRTRGGQQLRLSVRVSRLTQPEALYLVTMRDVTAEQREHQDVKHAYLVISRILAIADDAIVNVDAQRRTSRSSTGRPSSCSDIAPTKCWANRSIACCRNGIAPSTARTSTHSNAASRRRD